MFDLTAATAPTALPSGSTPYGSEPFRPMHCVAGDAVVAGGHHALCIAKAGAITATINAQVHIAGFALRNDTLYVQDGTVLSSWSVASGNCLAAINLHAPAQRWVSSAGALDSAALQNVHALPADLTEKQAALQKARRRAEWAHLHAAAVAALEAAQSSGHLGVKELVPLGQLPLDLETLITGQPALGDPDPITIGRPVFDALHQAEVAAAPIVFSAPVISSGTRADGGCVFVLGLDGRIHVLNAGLQLLTVTQQSAPVKLRLTLLETSSPPAIHGYYITTSGIQGVDLTGTPASLGEWSASGTVQPDAQLLLEAANGQLLTRGVLGPQCVMLDPQPGSSPVFTLDDGVSPWSVHDISKQGLVLFTDYNQRRMAALGRDLARRDRWHDAKHKETHQPWISALWPGAAADDGSQPLLVLEFDREPVGGANAVEYRVFAANPYDAPNPICWKWFPPTPTMLERGVVQPSSPDAASRLIWARGRPLITRDAAWMVGRAETAHDAIRALAAQPAQGPSRWRQRLAEIQQQYPAATQHLGEIALPDVGHDALYSYSLGALASHLQPAAQAEVARFERLTHTLQIQVVIQVVIGGSASQPMPLKDTKIFLFVDGGQRLTVMLDGNGMAWIDPSFAGRKIWLPTGESCVPQLDQVNVINALGDSSWIKQISNAAPSA